MHQCTNAVNIKVGLIDYILSCGNNMIKYDSLSTEKGPASAGQLAFEVKREVSYSLIYISCL